VTETEWLEGSDPSSLLMSIRPGLTDRKKRLLCVAFCRHIGELFSYLYDYHAVEIAERSAEGLTSAEERNDAYWKIRDRFSYLNSEPDGSTVQAGLAALTGDPVRTALAVAGAFAVLADAAGNPYWDGDGETGRVAESNAQCGLVREIMGNPFRPVAFDTAWATETAVRLGTSMYEDRDFAAMPILADALEDAGCDARDILDHCRGPGPHVRGCWVVDLLLGKH
jgi:hypothetical protein